MFAKNIFLLARNIIRHKAYYLLNIIGLVIGIFVFTVIVLYASREFSMDNFHQKARRIYRLNCGGYGVTPLCFRNLLQDKIPELENSVRLCFSDLSIIHNNEKIKIDRMCYTDSTIFQVFTLPLVEGNPETALKNPFSLVLTQSEARKLFGSSPPVGKTIVNEQNFSFTITGIMKDLPGNSHLRVNGFMSISSMPILKNEPKVLDDCGSWQHLTYILLKENSNKMAAEKKINSLLEDRKMGTKDGKIPLRLEPLRSIYFDPDGNKFDNSEHGNLLTIFVFLAIAALTLAMACINYVNLAVAKAAERAREVNIRKICGAFRVQLIIQFLTESVVVSLISTFAAIIMVEALLPTLGSRLGIDFLLPANRPAWYLICLTGSLILGLVSGLYPAIIVSTTGTSMPLRSPSPGTRKGLVRKILVITQFALSIVFLISAFTVIGQIRFMLKKDIGFQPGQVICVNLDPQMAKKKDVLKKLILQNPSIEKVAFADAMIGGGFGKRPTGEEGRKELCNFFSADPDLIELLEIRMSSGRNYSWNNPADTSGSIILNETAARIFEKGSSTGSKFEKQILVGITRDFNFSSLRNTIEPLMIRCLRDNGSILYIKISGKHAKQSIEHIIRSCREVNPGFDGNYTFLSDTMKKLYSAELTLAGGLAFYSAIALIISVLGLIGLTLFMLEKRQREIAIRKVHGASVKRIFLLLSGDFAKWIMLANLIAIPVAVLTGRRWLQNFAYHKPLDPFICLFAALLSFSIAYLVVWIMSLKSARANPADVLREE